MSEHWLAVVNSVGYEVSDLGHVRSIDRLIVDSIGRRRRWPGRPLVAQIGKRGYLVVTLGKSDHRYVHTLVLEAFVGPRPTPDHEARHGDDDRANAALTNLCWGTSAENHQDMLDRGRHNQANRVECQREHPLVGANLVPSQLARGAGRRCLACSRAQNWCRYHRRPDLLRVVADAYYAEITGDGGAALRALDIGLTSNRSLVVTGGNSK